MTKPLLLPPPEMVTIPAGPFLMGSERFENARPVREIHVSEFQIGKYEVTNEEFDRYIDVYRKSPFALLGTKAPYRDLLIAWGGTDRRVRISEKDVSLLKSGKALIEPIFETASSLEVPPILKRDFSLSDSAVYGAYAVFSDWAESLNLDPFCLLAGLLDEMESTKTCFEIRRVVPKLGKRRKALDQASCGSEALLGPRQPAVCLDWYQAYGFARAVGMRLPTEAEWEKAAKGPEGYEYGTASGTLRSYEAHFAEYESADVGSYPANGYDLHDMTGNVYEWMMSWYRKDYYREMPERDPKGPETGERGEDEKGEYAESKVWRGGSWPWLEPEHLRAAHRNYSNADFVDSDVGFRVARDSGKV